jgi:hypothetical protein
MVLRSDLGRTVLVITTVFGNKPERKATESKIKLPDTT